MKKNYLKLVNLDNSKHIQDWYTQIHIPTYDDVEDFRVMLLDLRNNSDANAAIDGISTNLLENGWNEELMQLLIMAAMPNTEPEVQDKALLFLTIFLLLYDSIFRISYSVIDGVLEILSDSDAKEEIMHYLMLISQAKNALQILDQHVDVKGSLLYDLASAQHPE